MSKAPASIYRRARDVIAPPLRLGHGSRGTTPPGSTATSTTPPAEFEATVYATNPTDHWSEFQKLERPIKAGDLTVGLRRLSSSPW